jgi:hypothetical protein
MPCRCAGRTAWPARARAAARPKYRRSRRGSMALPGAQAVLRARRDDLEDSPIPFTEWLPAFWLLANTKNGTSCELARALGVTQKTAWFMRHRIRETMATKTFARKFAGVVDRRARRESRRVHRPECAAGHAPADPAAARPPRRDPLHGRRAHLLGDGQALPDPRDGEPPPFQVCVYCDPSDLTCPGEISIDIGGSSGTGSGIPTGPSCPQVIFGPHGTFDGTRNGATYQVPRYARTGWTILSSSHVDQVDVDFFDGAIYSGGRATGGSSYASVGYFTLQPPTNGPFDATQMTGSWIDKDTSAGHEDLSFTATASSSC